MEPPGDTAARRGNDISTHASRAQRRKALSDELAAMPATRLEAEIRLAMGRVEIDPITLRRTNHCQPDMITLEASRKACQPLLELHTENARAKRKAAISTELSTLDSQLADKPPPASADPQTAQLVWIASRFGIQLADDDVARAATLIWSVALEVVAALALSLAGVIDDAAERRRVRALATLRNPAPAQPEKPAPAAEPLKPAEPKPPAAVTVGSFLGSYRSAGKIAATEVYRAYEAACTAAGSEPVEAAACFRQLTAHAKAVGATKVKSGGRIVYDGLGSAALRVVN